METKKCTAGYWYGRRFITVYCYVHQGNTALHWAIFAKNSAATSILVNKTKGSEILVMKNAQVSLA